MVVDIEIQVIWLVRLGTGVIDLLSQYLPAGRPDLSGYEFFKEPSGSAASQGAISHSIVGNLPETSTILIYV